MIKYLISYASSYRLPPFYVMLRQSIYLLLAVPAWCMYQLLDFAVNEIVPYFIPAFARWTETGTIVFMVSELSILVLLNRLRTWCADTVHDRLPPSLPHWFLYMYLYAAGCWITGTILLICSLWQLPFDVSLRMLFQMLLMCCYIGVMMGLAIPWSAARFALLLWHERKIGR